MARIRTVKPEFWEDSIIGSLSREARLLFIASWNLADDEGLLRWSPEFLKAGAFIYDDDIDVNRVRECMDALVDSGLVFSYNSGRMKQPFAYIINFHKHQRINRPTPSKLPPPPVSNSIVIEMYARRDGWKCHLCQGDIDHQPTTVPLEPDLMASPDHVIPVSKGGSDYPTNIKSSHRTCNIGRRDRPVDVAKETIASGNSWVTRGFPERNVPRGTHSEPLTEKFIKTLGVSHQEIPQEVELEVEKEPGREVDSSLPPKNSDFLVEQIFRAYPDNDHRDRGRVLQVPPVDSLAIIGAINRHGVNCVLEGTRCYAKAVSQWPPGERQKIFGCTKFFNQEMYLFGPVKWERGDGKRQIGKGAERTNRNRETIVAGLERRYGSADVGSHGVDDGLQGSDAAGNRHVAEKVGALPGGKD